MRGGECQWGGRGWGYRRAHCLLSPTTSPFVLARPSANGSVLLEMSVNNFPANNGLQQCGQLMPIIVSLIANNGCPEISVADAIQVRHSTAQGGNCLMIVKCETRQDHPVMHLDGAGAPE